MFYTTAKPPNGEPKDAAELPRSNLHTLSLSVRGCCDPISHEGIHIGLISIAHIQDALEVGALCFDGVYIWFRV